MFALEEDTLDYYENLPQKLDEVGNAVILPSISIPLYGTPWYYQVLSEGRITDFDISHYEGDHVVFKHKYLTEAQIYACYKKVNEHFFSWKNILRRWLKIILKQRKEENVFQFLLKVFMVTFIYFKLSIFQKHHAENRIFNKVDAGRSVIDEKAFANKLLRHKYLITFLIKFIGVKDVETNYYNYNSYEFYLLSLWMFNNRGC